MTTILGLNNKTYDVQGLFFSRMKKNWPQPVVQNGAFYQD